MIFGGRSVAALLATAVLAVTAAAWSLNTPGTSTALEAAGDVGVVARPPGDAPPAARPPGDAPPAASPALGLQGSQARPPVPAQNILLIGSDARTDEQGNPLTLAQQRAIGAPADGGGVNTDTLIILHIPAGGRQATAVSVPRDTWMGPDVVGAPGVTGPDQFGHQVHYRPAKINSFYGSAKYYEAQYLTGKGITGPQRELESDEAGRTMLIKVI